MEQNITKEEIANLEVETFTGEIIVVQSTEEAEKAVAYLSTQLELGFDTETRPTFKKGVLHRVALIQLATDEFCFLFRLNLIGFPSSLAGLLSDPEIIKVGLSLRDDYLSMSRRKKFTPNGFIDLQSIVSHYGIGELSLQKVYALLFGKKISKNQRLTNWEADNLTEAQQNYAALDAWACLQIYRKLTNERIL